MERARTLDDPRSAGDASTWQGPAWRGFAALVAATHGLIVLGALVRVHGAGLACPDWPLCFGEVLPKFDFEIAFEWSHRVLAGGVALGFATLAGLCWRKLPSGDSLRRAFAAAGVLLGVQILLGALTVWQLLDFRTVTAHLMVGNTIAACFAWTALELRARHLGAAAGPKIPAGPRRVLIEVVGLLALQLALGGLVSSRYAGPVCPEWPTCAGGVWFPSWGGLVGLHLFHRLNGYLLLGALGWFAWRARGCGRLAPWARAAAALGLLQVGVGVANVVLAIPVEVTGLHSFLATALVLTLTGAVWTTQRASGSSPC